jgi:hypothetical protein
MLYRISRSELCFVQADRQDEWGLESSAMPVGTPSHLLPGPHCSVHGRRQRLELRAGAAP